MLWGFPWGVAWGAHQHFLTLFELVALGGGMIRVRFQPRAGYGQYFRLVVDGAMYGSAFFAEDDRVTEIIVQGDGSQILHHVSVAPQGAWGNNIFDVTIQQDLWEAGRSDRFRVAITPAPDLFSISDNGQLTNWSLSGIRRFFNCKPYFRRDTWAQLSITLGAPNNTVTLLIDGVAQAQGTRVGNGAIILNEQNGSGLSGSVDLIFSGAISGRVIMRFPASFPVHFKSAPFIGGDFPRAAEGRVFDDRKSERFVFRSGGLAAGTYYVIPRQTDDCANESTNLDAGGTAVVVQELPAAPGFPAYFSGAAADTVISFLASATALATYNIYDSGDTSFLDVDTVAATHAAGAGTLTQALAAISGTFTGIRYVLVRAVLAGVEEGNTQLLKLEYLAGVVVAGRPPRPVAGAKIVTSGRTLNVPVSIDTIEQAAAAVTLELYLFPVGGAPAIGFPDGTAAVPAALGGIVNVTVSALAGADGNFMFALRTLSAAGSRSDNTDEYGPVKLTTAAPAAPAEALVEAGY